jgi:hypothetical protein
MSARSEAWALVDLPAESDIIALVLRGDVRPKQLQPLAAKHYFSRLHAAVHSAAVSLGKRGVSLSVETVARYLVTLGMRSDCLDDLREIADAAPLLAAADISDHTRRLVELWRRRQILGALRQVQLALETGQLASADARVRLAAQIGAIA